MAWFRSDGQEMTDSDWHEVPVLAVGVFLNGQAIAPSDEYGRPVRGDSFMLVFNASHEPVDWKMPPRSWGASWAVEIDTAIPEGRKRSIAAGRTVKRPARSVLVLRRKERAASPVRP